MLLFLRRNVLLKSSLIVSTWSHGKSFLKFPKQSCSLLIFFLETEILKSVLPFPNFQSSIFEEREVQDEFLISLVQTKTNVKDPKQKMVIFVKQFANIFPKPCWVPQVNKLTHLFRQVAIQIISEPNQSQINISCIHTHL